MPAPKPEVKVKKEIIYITLKRSKTVVTVLAFFLGDLGLHKFYLGKNGQGIIYLLLSVIFSWTIFIPVIITIIYWVEAFGYITTSDKGFAKQYM